MQWWFISIKSKSGEGCNLVGLPDSKSALIAAMLARWFLWGRYCRCQVWLNVFICLQSVLLSLPSLAVLPEQHVTPAIDKFQLAFLADDTKQLTPEQVLSAVKSGQFEPIQGQHFTVGYSTSAYWLLLQIPAQSKLTPLFLSLDYPLLEYATLYQVVANTESEESARIQPLGESGSRILPTKRPVMATHHYFPLPLSTAEQTTYLLRVESQTSLSIPIRLLSETELDADHRYYHLWYGFIIGMMLLLIFYNLLVAWSMQESANAVYVVFLSALLFIFISITGVGNTYLWPIFSEPMLWFIPFCLHLLSISSYSFAGYYFSGSTLPTTAFVMMQRLRLFSCLLLASLLLDYPTAMLLAMVNALLMVLLLFSLAVYAAITKVQGSLLFLLGRFFVLSGGCVQFAKTFAIIPASNFTEYMLFLGAILEAIVLSGGLALKAKQLAQEKAQARAEMLANQQDSLAELTALNKTLAAEIEYKTQSETIQKALFTINELSAGDDNMQNFLQQIHRIVASLMFARNFYVALYDSQEQMVQFPYFADEKDQQLPKPHDRIPAENLAGSWTMWVIEHGKSLFGNAEQITALTGLPARFGSVARCWFGIPLFHEQRVIGVLVVQIYQHQPDYTEQEQQLLHYVSHHVSLAVQRKQYRNQLEWQVQERTQALTESLTNLKLLHRQLSQMNDQNTAHIAQMKLLLDNTGQGFLTCNAELQIEENYSKECLNIFQVSHLSGSIVTVLTQQDSHLADLLTDVLTEVLQPKQSSAMVLTYLSLLPTELKLLGRLYHTQYKRLSATKLLVILSDITEKTALAAALQQQQAHANFIMYALHQGQEVQQVLSSFYQLLVQYQLIDSLNLPDFFWQTVAPVLPCSAAKIHASITELLPLEPEVGSLVEPVVDSKIKTLPALELREVYRQIHTFKSLLAQIRCPELPQHLHQLEEQLQQYFEQAPSANELYHTLLAADLGTPLKAAIQLLAEHLPPSLLKPTTALSLAAMLQPQFLMAEQLAQSQGKMLAPIQYRGDDIVLDPLRYRATLQVLVHLFRNAVDHGIELPAIRRQMGKPEMATIECQVQSFVSHIELKIQDDGCGLDLQRIEEKAIELKVVTQSELIHFTADEKAQLIFADQLSTKEEVSEVSGRGVGLAAVRHQLISEGGTIRVHSQPGQGCCFVLTIPL